MWVTFTKCVNVLCMQVLYVQAKTKTLGGAPNPQMQTAPATQAAAVTQPAASSAGTQPDYSAQWAEYYRSLGKHKEAEAIEAQMKAKVKIYILRCVKHFKELI